MVNTSTAKTESLTGHRPNPERADRRELNARALARR